MIAAAQIDALIASFASLAAAVQASGSALSLAAEEPAPGTVEYCDAGGGFVMRRRAPTTEYGNEVDGFRMRRRIPR